MQTILKNSTLIDMKKERYRVNGKETVQNLIKELLKLQDLNVHSSLPVKHPTSWE